MLVMKRVAKWRNLKLRYETLRDRGRKRENMLCCPFLFVDYFKWNVENKSVTPVHLNR